MPKMSLHRSIEEIIVISASFLAVISIFPFAIYRFMQHQYTVAAVEVIVITAMAALGLFVWKTRQTKVSGIILSVITLASIVGLNYMIGSSIIYWAYPFIITVYFLNPLKVASFLVICIELALLPLLLMENSIIEVANFIVTFLITQVFSHIISTRIRDQHDRLQSLIDHDDLTGALNRRSLDDRLDLLQNLHFRHRSKGTNITSVILFKIDELESIRENHGDIEGDAILIKITNIIKKKIRKTDELYRYDNEKFALVANGAGLLKAAELAEKIRDLIENAKLSEKNNITASFGVAEVQKLEKSSKWLARAETALYRSKRAGKNRVFLANAERANELYEQISNL
jgi:diguanylate cyclase (GGDEF)-like protein